MVGWAIKPPVYQHYTYIIFKNQRVGFINFLRAKKMLPIRPRFLVTYMYIVWSMIRIFFYKSTTDLYHFKNTINQIKVRFGNDQTFILLNHIAIWGKSQFPPNIVRTIFCYDLIKCFPIVFLFYIPCVRTCLHTVFR